MKMMKPGDLCPCCGRPIPEGLDGSAMILLSYIAEGMAIKDAIQVTGATKLAPTEHVEYSEKELELLKALDVRGYKYLARNADGRLFGFADLPYLREDSEHGAVWVSRGETPRHRVFADHGFSTVDYETPLHIRSALQAAHRS